MSLTMQRLLRTVVLVVLPVLALAGLGALLHKSTRAGDPMATADVAPRTERGESGSESCAITSGAAIDAARVVCLSSTAEPGATAQPRQLRQLRLHDLSCTTCAPEPITEPREHISGFGVTADGKHVLFVSDAAPAGREQNFSLFRYDIDTHHRVELTPKETLDRDAPRLPRNRSDIVLYSARTQGESQTKVFAQPLDGEEAKLVYVDPEPGELVDVSDDGTRGVYRRFISPDKSLYFTVDLQKHSS